MSLPPPLATREVAAVPTEATSLSDRQAGWAERWAWEILFVIAIAGWILYELYGCAALEWLSQYTLYIRIAGGIVVIAYLWWQLRGDSASVRETMDLAKQLLRDSAGSGTTREKRNVTNAMKKVVGANYKWKCAGCSSMLDEGYQVDHILPLFKGGTNDISNLQPLCGTCHNKKSIRERINT